MSFGGLAFLNPALLAGLAALPLIWWLLRAVPPAPRRVAFPATRILVGLENRDKQSERTPWWLTLIRLARRRRPDLRARRTRAQSLNAKSNLQAPAPSPSLSITAGRPPHAGASAAPKLIAASPRPKPQAAPLSSCPPPPSTNHSRPRIEAAAQARSTAAALEPQPFAPDRARAARYF